MSACVTSHGVVHGGQENDDDWIFMDNPLDDDIEVAWLAIEYMQQMSVTDVWERPTKKLMHPQEGSTISHFEIALARIVPSQNDNPNVKRFVLYEVSVRKDSTVSDPNPATIHRRYTDFLNLYTNLKKDQPEVMKTVDFPRKVVLGNYSNDLIEERSSAFEVFLDYIVSKPSLRNSPHFLDFLQDIELKQACRLIDERRNESAVPLLENALRLLNKIFLDRSRPVLLVLCRLVVACTTSAIQHPSAYRWANLALRRYETLCDIDLLQLYIPLLYTCINLWWQHGSVQKLILDRLRDMARKGIDVSNRVTLTKAIHLLDPQSETI